jgi:DNA polymerase III subunit delta'
MLNPYPWQESQWQQLRAAHAQGRLSHALLLTGPEGIGLEQFSYSLAARLLCKDIQSNQTACGLCKPCILFQAGNHPDIIDIQPEEKGKQIKVDEIRQLVDFIHMKSHFSEYKLVIINPAEAMNRSAANSLLKTLEEPPPDSLLILLSSQPALLPVTIRSRCQRVNFSTIGTGEALQWLQSRLGEQQALAAELLLMAKGAPLKALSLLETDGIEQQQLILEDMESLRLRQSDPVKIAAKWLSQDATEVIKHLLDLFIIMSRLKLGAPGNNSTVHRHLQRLINGLDLVQLIACYDVLLRNYHALIGPISLNKQGLLEDFIISWQSIAEQQRG